MAGSSSQQRQLITYHVEFTEEEHPQPAPSPEHSLAYRRPTGGGRPVLDTDCSLQTTDYRLQAAGWAVFPVFCLSRCSCSLSANKMGLCRAAGLIS